MVVVLTEILYQQILGQGRSYIPHTGETLDRQVTACTTARGHREGGSHSRGDGQCEHASDRLETLADVAFIDDHRVADSRVGMAGRVTETPKRVYTIQSGWREERPE